MLSSPFSNLIIKSSISALIILSANVTIAIGSETVCSAFLKTRSSEVDDDNSTWTCPYVSKGVKFECNPLDPLACNRNLFEVCVFRNSTYRCECPVNHSRLPDGRCIVINECLEPRLNDCSDDAICRDTLDSYVCACKPGFVDFSPDDKPGRICKQDVNECLYPEKYGIKCDMNAHCRDTPKSYECVCNLGFTDTAELLGLPKGTKCEPDIDPCESVITNDCSTNAVCISSKGSYTCQCKNGFSDVSPNIHYPGRDCVTTVINDNKSCNASQNTAGFDWCACSHDCCVNANCIRKSTGYDCQCKPGFTDVSPQRDKLGRKCVSAEDKCAQLGKNDCSPFAKCMTELNSYSCQCENGYLDVSNQWGQIPGRVCIKEKHECNDPTLNSCDENANCVKKPDGYACVCQTGYHDVSSSANLKPGRVCTLVTSCPSQPTDLMFLIDGSFSIGPAVFKNDVLRFVREFASLFSVSSEETRLGVIQFSHVVRKEVYFNEHYTLASFQKAVNSIDYLKGMTRTGVAIDFMVKEGFNDSNGARTRDHKIQKIAVVITDGMPQDNVRTAAMRARKKGIRLFAIGVTDHVFENHLRLITRNKKNVFLVGTFADLNTKLRAVMQKELCPTEQIGDNECPKCDAARNYICKNNTCVCPKGFCENTIKKVCGFQTCNPDLGSVSCPYPTVCKETPYKTHRCACPDEFTCATEQGLCVKTLPLKCAENQTMNIFTGKCDFCDPPCETAKHQICLKSQSGEYYCSCKNQYTLDTVTQTCVINECLTTGMTNCSQNANCVDTLEGYYCTCKSGYKDNSPKGTFGIVCDKIENVCDAKKHDCSNDAECIPDAVGGFTCNCRPGFVDLYPPIPGRQCEHRQNECASTALHNCSMNADCFDLDIGYRCVCRPGFQDLSAQGRPGRLCLMDPCQDMSTNNCWLKRCRVKNITRGEFQCEPCPKSYFDGDPTQPGRLCKPKVYPCSDSRLNRCDANAFCIGISGSYEKYTCQCRHGFMDVSKDPVNRPGRKCQIIKNPCLDATTNDCHYQAVCTDLKNNTHKCACKDGFIDKSLHPAKSGRLCTKLINECLVPHLHNCSANALCTDMDEGYKCKCKDGYKDNSHENLLGRICTFIPDPCSSISLNQCDSKAKCTRTGDSTYTCECVPPYKDNTDHADQRGKQCIYDGCGHPTSNVCHANANCENGAGYVNCKCQDSFIDKNPLNPGVSCEPEPLCGDKRCRASLGLVCDYDLNTCKCKDEKSLQRTNDTPCIRVMPVPLYLWVARKSQVPFEYTSNMSNLSNPDVQDIIITFNKGLGTTFSGTILSKNYVSTVVREIQNPADRNVHWNKGLWIEFTTYLDHIHAFDDYSIWRIMVDSIKRGFNYSVGGTELYINEYQLPYACYKNKCDKNADCFETSSTSYTCRCFDGYMDLDANQQGGKCALITTTTTMATTTEPVDPCRDNDCDPNTSECMPSSNGYYTCSCKFGFYANTMFSTTGYGQKNQLIAAACLPDFCMDFPECPHLNGTCVNLPDMARCACNESFVDLRKYDAVKRRYCHGDKFCIRDIDIDHCCLQSHNCHPTATCISKPGGGYGCQCEIDGSWVREKDPCTSSLQFIAHKMLNEQESCEFCNLRGKCVLSDGHKFSCECSMWFMGETCSTDLRVIGAFIIAALAILSTLFIVVYLCVKKCLKRRTVYSDMASLSSGSMSASTLSRRRSTILSSDMAIPRAKLKTQTSDYCADRTCDIKGWKTSSQMSDYLDVSMDESTPNSLHNFDAADEKTNRKISSTLAEWDEITVQNAMENGAKIH